MRLVDIALDVEVGLGLLEADVGEVVEALVVETACVRDEADLERLARARPAGCAGGPAAGQREDHRGGYQTEKPKALMTHPHRSLKNMHGRCGGTVPLDRADCTPAYDCLR